MGEIALLNRTLEQELFALLRGASLECLVCGEFVMRIGESAYCPECRSQLAGAIAGKGANAITEVSETAG